jgi:hypothetical protein
LHSSVIILSAIKKAKRLADKAFGYEEASKIAAEFLMEAEKTDYCSCPNKKCPIHGNCFYCVQIHRGHGGHLPYCMFEMVNERLAGLASLTEGTLKSYMSKHPDVCSGIPIHKSNEVDE